MCGYGYPSTYAASGEEQVLHYMENRHTNLGYFVIFDSRLDQITTAKRSCQIGRQISTPSKRSIAMCGHGSVRGLDLFESH